jgi:hypothetical protein
VCRRTGEGDETFQIACQRRCFAGAGLIIHRLLLPVNRLS